MHKPISVVNSCLSVNLLLYRADEHCPEREHPDEDQRDRNRIQRRHPDDITQSGDRFEFVAPQVVHHRSVLPNRDEQRKHTCRNE